jgi:DNA polymerase III delta prime subunit
MIPLLIISKENKIITKYIDNLKQDSLFFEVTPATGEYSIENIKNTIKDVSIYNPKKRIYYFKDFHLSSIPAQNSFLKLLEEPPSNVLLVLTTDQKNRLLPTIISRVKIIKLDDKQKNDLNDNFVFDEKKIQLEQFKIKDRESALKTFLNLIYFFRKRLKNDKKSSIILKELLRLKQLLENNNLNPQLAIDQGLIFIWKKYSMK